MVVHFQGTLIFKIGDYFAMVDMTFPLVSEVDGDLAAHSCLGFFQVSSKYLPSTFQVPSKYLPSICKHFELAYYLGRAWVELG